MRSKDSNLPRTKGSLSGDLRAGSEGLNSLGNDLLSESLDADGAVGLVGDGLVKEGSSQEGCRASRPGTREEKSIPKKLSGTDRQRAERRGLA
jgi:hypothetical protein